MSPIDQYYARLAEAQERGPQVYGGNAEVASLKAFSRYHPTARMDFLDANGVLRWMTRPQARIYAVLSRLSVSGGTSKYRLIAAECLVAPSTVSRTALKLQAWGLFEIDITRGRNGGVTVRKVVDRFSQYASWARAKLSAMARKARERARLAVLKINVASFTLYMGHEEYDLRVAEYEKQKARTKELLLTEDATFRATRRWLEIPQHLRSFASRVFDERKRLAWDDPEGEDDAVAPI